MNPSDAHSSLATLRQLKEMLDAGTLTPQEFETLKQQLVFGKETAGPVAAPVVPGPPAPAVTAPMPAPIVAPLAPPPASIAEPTPEPISLVSAAPELLGPPPELLPEPPPNALAWQVPATAEADADLAAESAAYPEAERRNPLTLVFAIGGALVLLALVLYLALGSRPDSEHLTSATRTAADSTAVVPEVGPQVEQITLPPATAPETVRVAPAPPPPAAAATQFRADSVAAPAAPAAKVAPAPVAPPTKVPVTTTLSTDTAI